MDIIDIQIELIRLEKILNEDKNIVKNTNIEFGLQLALNELHDTMKRCNIK